MPGKLLELTGVSAGYGDIQVLWDVDLFIGTGEYVAILGSNGAGKSTLLKVIAGLIHPKSGEVTFEGRKITSLNAQARVPLGLSLAPEGRRLFAGMSVKENLLMGQKHPIFVVCKNVEDADVFIIAGFVYLEM